MEHITVTSQKRFIPAQAYGQFPSAITMVSFPACHNTKQNQYFY
jgi:hypothetical protein